MYFPKLPFKSVRRFVLFFKIKLSSAGKQQQKPVWTKQGECFKVWKHYK